MREEDAESRGKGVMRTIDRGAMELTIVIDILNYRYCILIENINSFYWFILRDILSGPLFKRLKKISQISDFSFAHKELRIAYVTYTYRLRRQFIVRI